MKDFLLQAVGLAALGTVADAVPLSDENRVLVRHGMLSLSQRPTLGMGTLMQVAGSTKKSPSIATTWHSRLAPRLNAAGRLGQPQLAVELLVTDRPDRALGIGPISRSTQCHPANAGAEHSACRHETGQGTIRLGFGAGPGVGRTRLASGRNRHRGRPIGRKIPSAGGAYRLGSDGDQARRSAPPAACRASTCTRPWPRAMNS